MAALPVTCSKWRHIRSRVQNGGTSGHVFKMAAHPVTCSKWRYIRSRVQNGGTSGHVFKMAAHPVTCSKWRHIRSRVQNGGTSGDVTGHVVDHPVSSRERPWATPLYLTCEPEPLFSPLLTSWKSKLNNKFGILRPKTDVISLVLKVLAMTFNLRYLTLGSILFHLRHQGRSPPKTNQLSALTYPIFPLSLKVIRSKPLKGFVKTWIWPHIVSTDTMV